MEVGLDSGYNQKGLKNLLLSNDFGALDASKPFMPFGGQPKKDTGFVIGHKEIFTKKNAAVRLNIEWAEISAFDQADINYGTGSSNYPATTLSFLSSGIWNTQNNAVDIFNGNYSQVNVFPSGVQVPDATVANIDDYENLSPSSVSGFLRLSLNDGFGYQAYIQDLSLYLIGQSKTPVTGTKPDEPYTPKIKSIYAGYSAYSLTDAATASTFAGREIRFFHLYPFGEGEQHKNLQPGSDVFLLPQFKHVTDGIPEPHSGEFYIGYRKAGTG